MHSITRSQFIAAIEAGIQAEPTLTEQERDALRQVAVSAKCFGDNFDFGCPASLAGVYNPCERRGLWSVGMLFAGEFDRQLIHAGIDYGSNPEHPYWMVSDV